MGVRERRRLRRHDVLASKKTLCLDLLTDIRRRSWIERFHLLDLGLADIRQVPDEVHQMPTCLLTPPASLCPSLVYQ